MIIYTTQRESIFKNIQKGEYIIAFFPCIRFENQALLQFRAENCGMKHWNDEQKLEYVLNYHKELNRLYCLITKLCIICLHNNIKLIIENPYSTQHYLQRYWCLKPKIIDYDRTENGDNFKKPTQYWFVNCEPKNNFIFEPIKLVEKKIVSDCNTVERSMINPQYVNRFIRQYILD